MGSTPKPIVFDDLRGSADVSARLMNLAVARTAEDLNIHRPTINDVSVEGCPGAVAFGIPRYTLFPSVFVGVMDAEISGAAALGAGGAVIREDGESEPIAHGSALGSDVGATHRATRSTDICRTPAVNASAGVASSGSAIALNLGASRSAFVASDATVDALVTAVNAQAIGLPGETPNRHSAPRSLALLCGVLERHG